MCPGGELTQPISARAIWGSWRHQRSADRGLRRESERVPPRCRVWSRPPSLVSLGRPRVIRLGAVPATPWRKSPTVSWVERSVFNGRDNGATRIRTGRDSLWRPPRTCLLYTSDAADDLLCV